MICLTCALTVFSVMVNASAISLFDLPSEINARTSHCRLVSSRHGVSRARCARSGARGFLPTSLGLKVLMGALERMRVGGTYVPLSLTEPVLPDRAKWARDTPWRELTRRQCDVLALISEGKSNKLIADALTMTESTVKAHVKQIIKRLHVANRTQAALIASRASWQSARH